MHLHPSPGADDADLGAGVGVDGAAAHVAGERRLQPLHDRPVVLLPHLPDGAVRVAHHPDPRVGTRHLAADRPDGSRPHELFALRTNPTIHSCTMQWIGSPATVVLFIVNPTSFCESD